MTEQEKKTISYLINEGYTQEKIAKLMDVSQSTISRYKKHPFLPLIEFPDGEPTD